MKRYKILIATITICILVSIIFYFLLYNENLTDETKKIKQINHYQEIVDDNSSNNSELTVVEKYQEAFNNTDIIAYLFIPNTNIKVPVAQANDNEYYLTHLLDKTKNSLGSVFLDYRNKITDQKLIVYGHNSENVNTEFHTLENYLNYSYYYEHKDIYLQTLTNEYHYEIFSVYIANTNYAHVNLNFTKEEFAKHIYWLQEQSLYNTSVNVSGYDKIILLQTCYLEEDNSYIIVVGKLVNN